MDFVAHLKGSIDIVNVVGEYVRLRKAGAGPRFTGLCPFHTEKTPSFSVHSTHQFYKCFGCGVSGDAIKFVMEIERLTFWEALKLLAERNGIPLPKRTEHADEESRKRARLVEMQEIAARQYMENFYSPAGREAQSYLQRRGVSREMAQEFGIGLSDRSGQQLVRLFERREFTPEEMEQSGLVLRRQDGGGAYDRFRGRLMFPIHSETGRVIAFGGRALAPDDEPKYMNSPETAIYRKSHVLYNLHRAKEGIRKASRTVLVEGYMDVIGVFAAGFREVVATCGTALTSWQVRSLKRHSDHVVINFDPDNAGSNATEKSIQVLLEEGVRLKVLQLDGGLDPDEYVKERGAEGYAQALEQARGYFFWLADRARSKFDLRTAEGRVAGFQFLLPAIHKMPDRLERLAIANDMAERLGVDQGVVIDEFKRAAGDRREPMPKVHRATPPDPTETLLLQAMLTNPEARDAIYSQLREVSAIGKFRTRGIFEALFRILDAGETPSFTELEARLNEADQHLLASIVFADDPSTESVGKEQAEACLRQLEARDRIAGRDELRAKIKAAERSGNLAEAFRLMEELQLTERE